MIFTVDWHIVIVVVSCSYHPENGHMGVRSMSVVTV
jgi:hypothetical protein